MKLRTRNVTVAKSVRQPAPVELQWDQPGREDHRMEAGIVVRGNHLSPGAKRMGMAEFAADPSIPGPVYKNEDNNGRDTTLANLKVELAFFDAAFDGGGSWRYMPCRQLQMFPFRQIEPVASSTLRDDMPVDKRDPTYFKALLEHIAARVKSKA